MQGRRRSHGVVLTLDPRAQQVGCKMGELPNQPTNKRTRPNQTNWEKTEYQTSKYIITSKYPCGLEVTWNNSKLLKDRHHGRQFTGSLGSDPVNISEQRFYNAKIWQEGKKGALARPWFYLALSGKCFLVDFMYLKASKKRRLESLSRFILVFLLFSHIFFLLFGFSMLLPQPKPRAHSWKPQARHRSLLPSGCGTHSRSNWTSPYGSRRR